MAPKKTVICAHCKRKMVLKGPYHAGFSNQGFLYCDKDSTILVFDTFNRCYNNVIPNKHPWMLTIQERQTVEHRLKPCPCGGLFKFGNKPRCPHCEKLIGEFADSMHYVIIGKLVNGNNRSAWKILTQDKGD